MNNAAFENAMENVRQHRNIKLITTEKRRIYLMAELTYHTTKFFTKIVLAIEMKNYDLRINYELDTPLSKENNKKLIWSIKNELGEKAMTKFFWWRAKTYSYFIDDGSENKKAKGTKKCIIKKIFKLRIIKTV